MMVEGDTLPHAAPVDVAGSVVVVTATLWLTCLCAWFVDHGEYLQFVRIAITAMSFAFVGGYGLVRAVQRPFQLRPVLIGPLACAYIVLRWACSSKLYAEFGSKLTIPEIRTLVPSRLAWTSAGGYCAVVLLMALVLRRRFWWPRNVCMSLVGGLGAPAFAWDCAVNFYQRLALFDERLALISAGTTHALALWIAVSCVFVLLACGILARRPKSVSERVFVRFAGWLCEAVSISVIVASQCWQLLNESFEGRRVGAALGAIALMAAGVFLLRCRLGEAPSRPAKPASYRS